MRAFIAMEIKNESVKDNIIKIQEELIKQYTFVKPVKRDQLHFTLLFLGEIDESMLIKIKESLKALTFKPVEVIYKGIGAFPNTRSARVIWIGVDENSSNELRKIAKMVEDKLAPLGFENDKEFTAHITILRAKDRVSIRESNDVIGKELLDEIKVKKSELKPDGPIYTDLFTIHAC
ncbi:MAG: RNA 2',3'-cyclic phosphodiesterase [Candidatus Nitrosocaldaceae archaeon]